MKFKKLFTFTLLFSLIFAPNVFADCSDYSEEDYDYIVKNSDPSDLDLTCSNGTLFTDDYLMRIESALTFSQTVPRKQCWKTIGIMTKREFNTVAELLETLSPYISARALARICDMSESQMLQYKAGIKKISPKNISRINKKMRTFAAELSEFTLLGA